MSYATAARPDHSALDVPTARGTILACFRDAVLELWGPDGLKQVAAGLPEDLARATVESAPLNYEWFPEAAVVAWYSALWNGPCDQQRSKFFQTLNRMLDRGFGRVQQVALRFATAHMVLDRAPALWRHDHSHGELTVDKDKKSARVILRDHPYTQDTLSCLAVAEIYRYCLSLSRVKNVTALHLREPNGLKVTLRWE